MADISRAPINELKDDRQESYNDLIICTLAKIGGEKYYLYLGEEKRVNKRIDGNLKIIQTIDAEIKRRKDSDGS